MKSYKTVFFLLLLFLSSLAEAGLPKQGMPEKFNEIELEVTAFYKPLPRPRQKIFVTGSYRREVRLNGSGITATGKPACVGHAAADPKILPMGSMLEVPGHGLVVVEDMGGQIKGKRLDIFVGEGDVGRKRAIDWGEKILDVKILRLGKKMA